MPASDSECLVRVGLYIHVFSSLCSLSLSLSCITVNQVLVVSSIINEYEAK